MHDRLQGTTLAVLRAGSPSEVVVPRRDGQVCPRLVAGPQPVRGRQASRGQDSQPQTRARICVPKPASPHTVISLPMDMEKGDTGRT